MDEKSTIVELISKYLNKELDESGQEQLESWIHADVENERLFQRVVSEGYLVKQARDSQKWQQLIWEKTKRERGAVFNVNWTKLTVAAAVILIVATSSYFLIFSPNDNTIAKKEDPVAPVDIKAPETIRGVIILENGKKIYLDSLANGTLLQDGTMKIQKFADGSISYTSSGPKSKNLVHNTLTNPRGSKIIAIELEDGSKVWLNNETVLKYPVVFANDERTVELNGEAYFEIAKDSKRKFTVKLNESTVQALGTEFNINAYPESQNNILVSLVNGKIKVANGSGNMLVKPGQQAVMAESKIQLKDGADFNAALAWKSGYIVCDHTDLSVILKQISRWYNVDIQLPVDFKAPQAIGEIPRNLTLSEVLRILELNTKVKFEVEGNVVKVRP